MISIQNIPNSLRYELRHLPGNIHAHPPITTPTQKIEQPATKRTRFSTTPLWVHETNTPPNVTLNPPTSPMARPATPTFDDYAPFTAHGDVRQAQTPTAPQHPPFSPLDEHPHPSHLKSPQKPHLAPLPFLASPASKRARQNRSIPPNVHLNTPRGLMAHLLNLWKPTTSKKERRRKQEFRIPKPDNATPTMHPL
jgi:hypothetical protein